MKDDNEYSFIKVAFIPCRCPVSWQFAQFVSFALFNYSMAAWKCILFNIIIIISYWHH